MQTVDMLNLILIVVLILIVLLGFVAILLILKMRKKDTDNNQEKIDIKDKEEKQNLITRSGKTINSIYKFMEFDKVIDNMIVRKNNKQYVMVVECKGINYDLLSAEEKNAVESGFIEFLNTLNFPIQLYVQTRKLNLNEILEQYEKRIENINDQIVKIDSQIGMARSRGNAEAVEKLQFEKRRKENILEYGLSIEEYTSRISENQNILQQKTYVIISYYIEEYGNISNYSKEELNDIAFTELYTRTQTVIRALASAEIVGKVLDSYELAELLYIAYNKDSADKFTLKDAMNADYERLYSTAKDVLEEKKNRIEKQIENEAADLAAKSIIKADEITRNERQKRVKAKAMEMVEEYKDELSKNVYQEAINQVRTANFNSEQTNNQPVYRKNV